MSKVEKARLKKHLNVDSALQKTLIETKKVINDLYTQRKEIIDRNTSLIV
jgi:hypothetical protein